MSILISSSLAFSMGGWRRQSFKSNSMIYDRAFKTVEAHLRESNSEGTIIPIEIYTQLVNGLNFRIIVAVEDPNKEVNLYDYLLYKSFDSPRNEIINFGLLPGTYENLSSEKTHNLQNKIKEYLGKTGTLVNINTIQVSKNIVHDDSFYVVETNVIHNGKTQTKSFVLAEEDGELSFKY
jgi:hypothetical protein